MTELSSNNCRTNKTEPMEFVFLLDNSAPDKIRICTLSDKTQNSQKTVGRSLKTQIYYFFVSCRTPTVGQNTKFIEDNETSRFCWTSLSWTNNKQQKMIPGEFSLLLFLLSLPPSCLESESGRSFLRGPKVGGWWVLSDNDRARKRRDFEAFWVPRRVTYTMTMGDPGISYVVPLYRKW